MKAHGKDEGIAERDKISKATLGKKIVSTPSKALGDLIKLKRAKSKSVNNYSRLYFSIGLCISFLFVITAFEWRFYDRGNVMDLGTVNSDFENVMDVPPTEQTPPPIKRIEQPQIIEVPNEDEILEDIEIVLDIEMTEEQVIEQRIFDEVEFEEEKEEKTDEIFTIVEKQPEPVGGMSAFYQFVSKNLQYPMLARRNNIEGRVYIEFVVEKDGLLTDIKIIKGIGGGCDEEAIRIIESAPKWNPGKQRGRPVRVKMVLPILFVLET